MSRLTDEDRRIIEEEILNEANYRRYDRFWHNHWRLLSHFSPKVRNTIFDIETLVIGIPVLIFWIYIVYRLFTHK